MKKFFKYISIGIISLLLVGVLGVVLVVTLVNPNKFKPVIEKTVYNATGRVLKLDGNISWTFYPNLGINLKDLSLSNPDGFIAKNSAGEFVKISSLNVSVALIPLLSRHIAIKDLTIDGLKLNLVKYDDKNNWSFSQPQENQPNLNNQVQESKALALELNGFSLTNTTINYDDYDLKKHYSLNNIKLILETSFTGGIAFNQNEKLLKLDKVSLNYNDKLLAKIDLKVKNFEQPEYTGNVEVTKLALNSILKEFAITPKSPLLNNLTFKGDIDGNLQQVKINKMLFNLSDKLRGRFNVGVDNLNGNPTYSGNLSLEPFNLNSLIVSATASSGSSYKSKTLFNQVLLSTKKFSGDSNNIKFSDLDIRFSDLLWIKLSGLNVNNFKAPLIRGDINIPSFNLNQVMLGLGNSAPKLANPNWLNNCGFSSNFTATTSWVNLQNLILQISDTRVSGNIRANSIQPISITENLAIDNLDLANISNINGFRVINKHIALSGNISSTGNGISGLSGKQILSVGNILVKGISLDSLILEFDQSITRVGGSGGDVVKLLVNSSDVLKTINKIKTDAVNATKAGQKDMSKTTNLGTLNVNATINKGIVSPSSFKLNGPSAIIIGSGVINLPNKNLNYVAKAKLVLNGINPIFKQLEVPVTVSGTFMQPSSSVDWLSLQSQLLKYAVNQNKGHIEKAIKDNINQAVGNELKKNLGDKNANQAVDEVSKNLTNAIGNLLGGSSNNSKPTK